MSRTRAAADPFWAVAINHMSPAGQRLVRGLHALIQRSPALASIIWLGSGYRSGSTEHASGRALDIMITDTTGKIPTPAERAAALALVDWLIANATTLGIQWVLFSRDGRPRTESYNIDRGTWKALADRGSVSANHIDHIHVYLKSDGAGWNPRLDATIVGSAGAGGQSLPAVSLSALRTAARTNPARKDQAVTYPGVTIVEQALVAENLLESRYADGHFGTVTITAYRRWQEWLGYRGKDADGIPGRASLAKLGARNGFAVTD